MFGIHTENVNRDTLNRIVVDPALLDKIEITLFISFR